MRLGCGRSEVLQKYLQGSLDDREMSAFERHAAGCPECSAALDRELEPLANSLRRLAAQQPVPSQVHEAVNRALLPRPRRRWLPWALPALAAATALLWFQMRPPILRASGVLGVVIADGKPLWEGAMLSSGALVKTVGPAALQFGGLTVATDSGMNRFILVREGDRWWIKDPIAPVRFVHVGEDIRYGALLGSKRYEPTGTRFQLDPDGSIAVFEHSVQVQADTTRTVRAGETLREGKNGLVEDDPTRFMGDGIQLPGRLGTWRAGLKVNFEAGPSWPTKGKVLAELERQGRGSYARVAVLLARDYDMGGSEAALRLALREDAQLGALSDQDMLLLVADHLAFGSGQTARDLAERFALRSRLGLGVWGNLLSTKSQPDQIRFGLEALPATRGEEGIALASFVARLAIMVHLDPDEGKYDLDALRKCAAWFSAFLEREAPAGSVRARATALAQLAEAQRYLPDTELQSLETLRASVFLWPDPERVVNFCARVSELSDPTDDDRALLLNAFVAKPSFRSAERVLTFLRDTANSEERHQAVTDFAEWICKTYTSVANAQAIAAEHLMDVDPSLAAEPFARMRELARGDFGKLEPQHAAAYARNEWRLAQGRQSRALAEQIALECGLKQDSGYGLVSYSFFMESGLVDDALLSIQQSNMDELGKLSMKGKVLQSAGRKGEAADAYREYIKVRGEPFPLDLPDFDNRLSLAEVLVDTSPSEARRLARWVLGQDLSVVRRGWREIQRYDLTFRARAEWILGRKAEAIAHQRSFLAQWAPASIKDVEAARLGQWTRSGG